MTDVYISFGSDCVGVSSKGMAEYWKQSGDQQGSRRGSPWMLLKCGATEGSRDDALGPDFGAQILVSSVGYPGTRGVRVSQPGFANES